MKNNNFEEQVRAEFENLKLTDKELRIDSNLTDWYWQGYKARADHDRKEIEEYKWLVENLEKDKEELKVQLKKKDEELGGAKIMVGVLYRHLLPVFESEELRSEEIFENEYFEELSLDMDSAYKAIAGVFDQSEYYTFKKENQKLKSLLRTARSMVRYYSYLKNTQEQLIYIMAVKQFLEDTEEMGE